MSTIKVSNIQSLSSATLPVIKDSAGTEYGRFCRAFVNFDGTGTTSTNQTIRASFNVSSVYKNAPGDYTVNFTTSMADANYGVAGSSGGQGSTSNGAIYQFDQASAKTTTAARILTLTTAGSAVDTPQIAVAIFR